MNYPKSQYSEYIELQKCPLCGNTRKNTLFTARDLLMNCPGDFRVEQCSECGFKYTNPRPSPDSILEYYTSEYYAYHSSSKIEITPKYLEPKTKISFTRKAYNLDGGYYGCRAWVFPQLAKGSRVLELGCGSGSFIRQCVYRGWETTGMDLNPDLESIIGELGAKFVPTTLPKIDFPDNSLDAVFAWQVVEHLYDPVTTVAEVKRVLKPGGIFAFSVPNSECWQFFFFKDKWAGLQVPTHLNHFSASTLKRLVNLAGLSLIKIYPQNTIGCLFPSILLSMNKTRVSLTPEIQNRWMSLSLKIIDRVAGILISSFGGIQQAERLTVICEKKSWRGENDSN
jgi:SAM-dependent methyltransferase